MPVVVFVTDIAGSREGALKGLSRMMGNYHVRFLGGACGRVTVPVGRQRPPPTRRQQLHSLLARYVNA